MKTLDLSKRNIFNLNNISLLSKMKKLKTINIKDHELRDFEESNKLISLIKTISKLQNIICDQQIEEILWNLHDNKKLSDLCPTLKTINGYFLSFGRPK